jgi:hypothetical protein
MHGKDGGGQRASQPRQRDTPQRRTPQCEARQSQARQTRQRQARRSRQSWQAIARQARQITCHAGSRPTSWRCRYAPAEESPGPG